MSNLCSKGRSDASQEVLNFKILDTVSRMLDPFASFRPVPLDVLETTLWYLENLSTKFETRHISPECEQPLIQALILALHVTEDYSIPQKESDIIIRQALAILLDLTKCDRKVFGKIDERCDFAIE